MNFVLTQALRGLRKDYGANLLVVAVLSVGIASVLIIFSFVKAMVIDAPPFANAAQVVPDMLPPAPRYTSRIWTSARLKTGCVDFHQSWVRANIFMGYDPAVVSARLAACPDVASSTNR